MNIWNKPCVILASGPGLTDQQVQHVRDRVADCYIITVNATYARAPWADVYYSGDFLFWKVHRMVIQATAKQNVAECWTQDHAAAERYGIKRVKGVNRPGLGQACVHTGGNSGYQAINLAYLWGAKKIILLGFTMREIDGRKHWHDDHPKPLVQQILPDEWRHKMKPLAADLEKVGVEVVNCDPLSALTCFRMSTIEKELP